MEETKGDGKAWSEEQLQYQLKITDSQGTDQRWGEAVVLPGAVEVVLFDIGLVDCVGRSLRGTQSVSSNVVLWSDQVKGFVSDELLMILKHNQQTQLMQI